MTTSDRWLKILLKKLVESVDGVNSSGCRGVEVGNEAFNYCKGFGGRVGMERPYGDVDEK